MKDDDRIRRVQDAARRVFERVGFRRATMGEVADEAGMSRPALYLVYASKEELFSAVLKIYMDGALAEIRAGLGRDQTIDRKLAFAFDVWCVRPYEMVRASPEAGDLLESSHAFATDIVEAGFAEFDKIVAHLLKPLVKRQTRVKNSALQIARLMTSAALGFKQAAKNTTTLRHLIAGQIAIVLAGLRD